MGHREWWGASAPGVVGQLGLGETLTMSITRTMFFCSLPEKHCVNECRLDQRRRRHGRAEQCCLSLLPPAAVELNVQEVTPARAAGSYRLGNVCVQLVGFRCRRVTLHQVATGLSTRAVLKKVTACVVLPA